MDIKFFNITNFKCFSNVRLELDKINILIGKNNSGKSSIIKSLLLLQDNSENHAFNIRQGNITSYFQYKFINLNSLVLKNTYITPDFNNECLLRVRIDKPKDSGWYSTTIEEQIELSSTLFPSTEPNNFIVPFLAKRKTLGFQSDVNAKNANTVHTTMSNLASKLSKLNGGHPRFLQYSRACKDILGFIVTAYPSENGHSIGIYTSDDQTLSINQMGDGVPQIVALLVELTFAKNKLFLIEELENDLHPSALKFLLDLIIASSEHNQFVISTHSNIVLRHLGAEENSLIYHVETKSDNSVPESQVTLIERTPEARLEILRELGYSFSDFELWDGWLILEESSAETIIRKYLIPWFTPLLSNIRTLSANGINKVEPIFEDFNRLVLFTHLERAYTNKTWVRVDGDSIGNETVTNLQKKYKTWEKDRFGCFNKGQFEWYYPIDFHQRVENVLSIKDNKKRREEKRILLEDVINWLNQDESRAKEALSTSAADIISELKLIQAELLNINIGR